MRIALLVGASPKSCQGGPRVRLPAGKWTLDIEGLVDSLINLHCGKLTAVVSPDLEFDVDAPVQLLFDKRGTEQYITITAVKV